VYVGTEGEPARHGLDTCAWPGLSRSKTASAFRRGGRPRRVEERAVEIQTVLRSDQLEAPPVVADAVSDH
jgi:hypothetical protein